MGKTFIIRNCEMGDFFFFFFFCCFCGGRGGGFIIIIIIIIVVVVVVSINTLWDFMRIVSWGDNCMKYQSLLSGKKKNKTNITNLSSAECDNSLIVLLSLVFVQMVLV